MNASTYLRASATSLPRYILRHDPDGGDADKDDEGGQNIKGVRKFQRKSDDTHVVILTVGGSSSFSDGLLYFERGVLVAVSTCSRK
jgi:hypothetical protein